MTLAVRGAIQVSSNDADDIQKSGYRLLETVLSVNKVSCEDIVSIIFSVTPDLTRGNPATAVRGAGYTDTPLFCVQEALVDGQPGRIIRMLLTYRGGRDRKPCPVYLDGAEVLRPDLPPLS
mgnify:CR=1 FL=1